MHTKDSTPSPAGHVDRTFRNLYDRGVLGARPEPTEPAIIIQHPSAPVTLTPAQQLVADRVRAKFEGRQTPSVDQIERDNAIYFLGQLVEEHGAQVIQQTLALASYFSIEDVQTWLINIKLRRGEGA